MENTDNRIEPIENGEKDGINEIKGNGFNGESVQVEETVNAERPTGETANAQYQSDGNVFNGYGRNVYYDGIQSESYRYNLNAEAVAEIERRRALNQERTARGKARLPLIFSLLGLLCSLFVGLGIVFSIVGLILGCINNSKKPSKISKWAIIIAIVGIVVSFIFILSMIYAFIAGYAEYLKFLG